MCDIDIKYTSIASHIVVHILRTSLKQFNKSTHLFAEIAGRDLNLLRKSDKIPLLPLIRWLNDNHEHWLM